MIFLVFAIGLIIGSFLNVLIYRLNVEGVPKFWQGRSFCPNCKHKLSASDNIPLLSYFLLKGCCRYCKNPISRQYPVVELTTAICFILSWLLFPPLSLFTALLNYLFISLLLLVFFSDYIYGLIPDEAVVLILLIGLFRLYILHSTFYILPSILSAFFASGFFLSIFLLTRGRGIGFGDVKYGLAMGFLLGWPNTLLGLYISFILGGFIGVGLLLLKKKGIGSTIALGPFLVIGTLIAYFYGDKILPFILSRLYAS